MLPTLRINTTSGAGLPHAACHKLGYMRLTRLRKAGISLQATQAIPDPLLLVDAQPCDPCFPAAVLEEDEPRLDVLTDAEGQVGEVETFGRDQRRR